MLPLEQYDAVEKYLTTVFGSRTGPGWAADDIGVTILLLKIRTNTEVAIHPAMSFGQQEKAVRKIIESVDKNAEK